MPLTAVAGFFILASMPKQEKESAVLYVREAQRELTQTLKGALPLCRERDLQAYLLEMLQNHVNELERKGMLPRGK